MKQPKVKKVKIYEYHVWNSFITKGGQKTDMLTQLYQIGIYAIINNDPAMQLNLTPKDIVKIEKDLNKRMLSGDITELEYGRSISVYENEEEFWTEKID